VADLEVPIRVTQRFGRPFGTRNLSIERLPKVETLAIQVSYRDKRAAKPKTKLKTAKKPLRRPKNIKNLFVRGF
jgi:hypothetical protein